MSGNTNQHSSYTASDIEKYLKGELSAPEMHRLEKTALDDPFLADAMEGMEMHHSTMQNDLNDIQERLQKRVSGKDEEQSAILAGKTTFPVLPVVPPPAGRSMWKMAAVFILLIGIGGITYFSFFKGKSMYNLAVEQKKPVTTSPRLDTTLPRSEGPSSTPTVPSPKKVKPSTNSFNLSTNPSPGLDISRDFEKATDTHPRSLVFKTPPPPSYTSNYAGNAANGFLQVPVPPLLVSGKVVDQNNKPLSGVSLSLDGKNKFTAVTDNNGQYNLRLPTQDSSARLRASSVGYQDFAMSLNTDNRVGNVIQLKPENASLNEVVVVGYGSKKRKHSAEEETLAKDDLAPVRNMESMNPKAEPVVGWPSYKIYLETNKNTGKADSASKGEVVLSFRVDKNGVLSSFRIEKSLSPTHDSTLLHLVQQGPSWKLLKGKKAKATVILSF